MIENKDIYDLTGRLGSECTKELLDGNYSIDFVEILSAFKKNL